jgi:hypothetical protein
MVGGVPTLRLSIESVAMFVGFDVPNFKEWEASEECGVDAPLVFFVHPTHQHRRGSFRPTQHREPQFWLNCEEI